MLSENDKQVLLQAARHSIEAAVQHRPAPMLTTHSTILCQPHGAFVTIRKKGELRGCIGYIEAVKPLLETIIDVAPKAALEDPRFSPVTEDELAELELEISVLTPIQQVKDINEIIVGKNGVVVELGPYRGLLLPQVATEYGWDRETLLNQTARKAGLSPDAWRHPEVKIFTFSAEVFDERSTQTATQ